MNKRHRIFIAINLPDEVKKTLTGFEKKWSDLPARWVNAENLHITLVFLGYLDDVELGEFCMAVKGMTQKCKSFSISLSSITYGPIGDKMPRMVWANGEKSKELSNLKVNLKEALSKKINYKPEKGGFNIHITLARIKQMEFRNLDIEERPEINESIDLKIPVDSIEVMESVLKRTGPDYSIIESFQLNSVT